MENFFSVTVNILENTAVIIRYITIDTIYTETSPEEVRMEFVIFDRS